MGVNVSQDFQKFPVLCRARNELLEVPSTYGKYLPKCTPP